PFCKRRPVKSVFDRRDDGVSSLRAAGDQVPAVHSEKPAGAQQSRSLVSVEEWMNLDEMKGVRRGHHKGKLVRQLAADALLWLGGRRVQESEVPNAADSAVLRDRRLVPSERIVHCPRSRPAQGGSLAHWASFRSDSPCLENMNLAAFWDLESRRPCRHCSRK